MHRTTWVAQIILGVYFVAIGVLHFVVPEGLPDPLAWMYELSDALHYLSGAAEILGGLGLILPGITRIKPVLTPLAAAGLTLLMLLAAAWHVPRGEGQNIVTNLVLAGVLALVGYVRWRRQPLEPRSSDTAGG
ncbi:MAG: DoxX family protein [Nitriliruptoraceae bacterium]